MRKHQIVLVLEHARAVTLKSITAVIICTFLTFFFAMDILRLLQRTSGLKIYYLSLPEAFFTRIDLSLLGGVFFAWPIIAYFLWRHIHDVFTSVHLGHGILLFGIFLFYIGSLFSFQFVLPSGIQFLVSYGGSSIRPMISMHQFVFFAASMVFAFGIAFEIPIIMVTASKLGLVKSGLLSRSRKYAFLAIAAAAALITPTPDIYNMALLAIPMYVLYESGILLVKMREKRSYRHVGNAR